MSKQWRETVDGHRRDVRTAVVEAAAAVISEHGLRGATMSEIADAAGIGRATLYRYFPDAQAILVAWHQQQVAAHLEELTRIRDRAAPDERLEAVLEGYARLSHHAHSHNAELAAALHRDPRRETAKARVREMLRELLSEGIIAGSVRSDIDVGELAVYCLSALDAASELRSKAAVRRLVAVTLAGLRPQLDNERLLRRPVRRD